MIEPRVLVYQLRLIEHGEPFTTPEHANVCSTPNSSNAWLETLHSGLCIYKHLNKINSILRWEVGKIDVRPYLSAQSSKVVLRNATLLNQASTQSGIKAHDKPLDIVRLPGPSNSFAPIMLERHAVVAYI